MADTILTPDDTEVRLYLLRRALDRLAAAAELLSSAAGVLNGLAVDLARREAEAKIATATPATPATPADTRAN